jgi:hypothetical protein
MRILRLQLDHYIGLIVTRGFVCKEVIMEDGQVFVMKTCCPKRIKRIILERVGINVRRQDLLPRNKAGLLNAISLCVSILREEVSL